MSAWLDSNVVVRYLVGSPPEMAARAREVIDSGQPLLLSSATIAEAWHVITKVYLVPRDETLDALLGLVWMRSVLTTDAEKHLIAEGLEFCRASGRVSCDDALLWAAARSSATRGEPPRVYTFDKRFPRQDIKIVEP